MAQFTNQAQLSYNNSVTNSNITVGELLEVLSVTKSAVLEHYAQNEDVTYVISIINSGNTPYNGLTVTDNLGAYEFADTTLYPLTYIDNSIRYYINGILQPAPAATTQPSLTISGISVPANGNVTLIFEADVNQYAPLGTADSIISTATVTGGGLTTPISSTEKVNTKMRANLSIIKSLSPIPVTENGILTYTFTIQNTGNTDASADDNVTLSDTFLPALSNITVTFNGTTLATPADYVYDEATGEFATVPGIITVPSATYAQEPLDGNWIVTPGVSTLIVSGTV